ncbi:hypothetical protein [Streptomyces exfoliatus]|uniref:hypothetical protein n=1 Tax=Streptomyces exfoliatus TaxID=1905 RepID=UPI003C2B748A
MAHCRTTAPISPEKSAKAIEEDVEPSATRDGGHAAESTSAAVMEFGPKDGFGTDGKPESALGRLAGRREEQVTMLMVRAASRRTPKGTRWTGVCPPCVGDDRRRAVAWIDVYVYDVTGGKARVHLQAF